MIAFIIQSSIVLIVLLTVYFLMLQNEKMFVFNRFYLLFSLIFSLVIPFISIKTNTVIPIETATISLPEIVLNGSEQKINLFPNLLFVIYIAITLLIFFRFLKNIFQMYSKSIRNKCSEFKGSKLVLLEEKTLPYAFFNCIYVNENDFYNNQIKNELLEHELLHVNQNHSIDIILIEFLKTIFWFNPIFIFYKKAIQLNHEFLADAKVIASFNQIPVYQTILLSFSNNQKNNFLTSNSTYLKTKKRFIMMNKKPNFAISIFKKAMLLPLFLALFFSNCIEIEAQQITKVTPKKSTKTIVKKSAASNNIKNKVAKTVKPEIEKTINRTEPKDNIVVSMNASPEFEGGIKAFYQYVGNNFKIPQDFIGNAKVFMSFVVEVDGSLNEIKAIKSPSLNLETEAIRVLKASPKWKPAYYLGKPKRCNYQLPISIQSAE